MVLINNRMLGRINRIELHLKPQVVGEEGNLTFEDRTQFLRSKDV
jgi:hypothetical protein